jgi:hypothetical protein
VCRAKAQHLPAVSQPPFLGSSRCSLGCPGVHATSGHQPRRSWCCGVQP